MSTDVLSFLDDSSSSDPLAFLEEGQPSRTRSVLSALPKGVIKGAQNLIGPPKFGSVPKKLGLKLTEQFLPTRKGEALEEILETTGENIPAAAFGEGGLLGKGLQAAGGALAKKGAKELGLPEWAQEIANIGGMVGPQAVKSAVSKTLKASPKQEKVVDFLKSKGLTDKEITPIIQNPKKLSFFSKGALKYEKKSPFIRGIKEKIGDIYEGIREQGAKSGYLRDKDLYHFEEGFHDKLQKIPHMYRDLIKKHVDHLMDHPISFTSLHDFNKAINATMKGVEGGKAAVGIMKKPVDEALNKLNPSLFSELKQANHAYSRIQDFTNKMTKSQWEGLFNLGHAGHLLYGLLTLNPAVLKGAGLLAATRLGLREILTNPRLQNMHSKLLSSLSKNKFPQALKIGELMQKELKKSAVKDEDSNHNPEAT